MQSECESWLGGGSWACKEAGLSDSQAGHPGAAGWRWLGAPGGLLQEIRWWLCRRRASPWLPMVDPNEETISGFKAFIVMAESACIEPYPTSQRGPEIKYPFVGMSVSERKFIG